MRRVAVALMHHPVVARDGAEMVTTITNLDLHDMSRCVRAYGLHAMYAVHPLANQRMIAERIRAHWVGGSGGRRIPDRALALERLQIVPDLPTATADLAGASDPAAVERWTTAAASRADETTPFAEARRRLSLAGPPVMICFGTGWGLSASFRQDAALRLEPIVARCDSGYHHLSVRSACAIALDRLFG